MERADIRDVVAKRFEEWFVDYKDCPKCGAETSFVKFSTYEKENEVGNYVVKLRCLNCLAVFKESLEEVA